jgi:hypothetical protein
MLADLCAGVPVRRIRLYEKECSGRTADGEVLNTGHGLELRLEKPVGVHEETGSWVTVLLVQ